MPLMNQASTSERESAYARIKTLIAGGEITPEVPISERSLSQRLGIGRTPVREAIKSLAEARILDVVPMRGTFLRQPSIDEVREIYEVRLAIEGMAALLAAQRGPSPALLAFRSKLAAFAEREDPASLKAMDRAGWDFHDAVVAAAGNRRMMAIYETIRLPIMGLRSSRPVDAARARASLREHLAILDAIESGEGGLAQSRIVRHLAGVLEARVRIATSSVPAAAAGFAESGSGGPARKRRRIAKGNVT
jgi:DNA-binding GntR family transcriptional regulator